MRLKGKVAIVTGGAKGLGRAFAIRLAEEGAKIMAVTRRDMANLKETVTRIKDIGGDASFFQADVSREANTKDMAAETIKKFGRIDILVNNAAVYDGIKRKPFYEIDSDEWDLVMSVNVKGAFLAARAVFPSMREQGYGKIVNLASEVFFTGSHGFAHYVSSKGGIIGLTRALALETAKAGITVNALCPGYVETPMLERAVDRIVATTKRDEQQTRGALAANNPQARFINPEEVAAAVLWLCAGDSAAITGQAISISGGETW